MQAKRLIKSEFYEMQNSVTEVNIFILIRSIPVWTVLYFLVTVRLLQWRHA